MAASVQLLSPTTPPSYHRIVSPSLRIPTDKSLPIPVGLLACQRDPLLRTIGTVVISAVISAPPAAPSKKPSKKAVLAPNISSHGSLLEVILHDTILFPEGGGQPTDVGLIITEDDEVEKVWDVLQIKRHGGHAVHFIKVDGDNESALKTFHAGKAVRVDLGESGYARRYDHMSMHTSQHLLSAVLETRLNIPTLSWSLTAYPSPCYVEIPRVMTSEEIRSIQDEANKLVFEGRQVHVEVEELDRDREEGVQKLASGRAVGKALPEDYIGGVKRVVVIDGVDRNPCCGTHLPSINNLQLFLIPHTDSLSRQATTSARLYFLTGPRLIAYLTSTHTFLSSTASLLSCGAPLVPERVALVLDDRKKADKRVQDLERELAQSTASQLVQAASQSSDDSYKKYIHREDDTSGSLAFLSAISTAFISLAAETLGEKQFVIILASSPSSQSSSSTTVVLAFGSDEEMVKHAGDELKKIGVKGGGKGNKWSGKFAGIWKSDTQGAAVEKIFE